MSHTHAPTPGGFVSLEQTSDTDTVSETSSVPESPKPTRSSKWELGAALSDSDNETLSEVGTEFVVACSRMKSGFTLNREDVAVPGMSATITVSQYAFDEVRRINASVLLGPDRLPMLVRMFVTLSAKTLVGIRVMPLLVQSVALRLSGATIQRLFGGLVVFDRGGAVCIDYAVAHAATLLAKYGLVDAGPHTLLCAARVAACVVQLGDAFRKAEQWTADVEVMWRELQALRKLYGRVWDHNKATQVGKLLEFAREFCGTESDCAELAVSAVVTIHGEAVRVQDLDMFALGTCAAAGLAFLWPAFLDVELPIPGVPCVGIVCPASLSAAANRLFPDVATVFPGREICAMLLEMSRCPPHWMPLLLGETAGALDKQGGRTELLKFDAVQDDGASSVFLADNVVQIVLGAVHPWVNLSVVSNREAFVGTHTHAARIRTPGLTPSFARPRGPGPLPTEFGADHSSHGPDSVSVSATSETAETAFHSGAGSGKGSGSAFTARGVAKSIASLAKDGSFGVAESAPTTFTLTDPTTTAGALSRAALVKLCGLLPMDGGSVVASFARPVAVLPVRDLPWLVIVSNAGTAVPTVWSTAAALYRAHCRTAGIDAGTGSDVECFNETTQKCASVLLAANTITNTAALASVQMPLARIFGAFMVALDFELTRVADEPGSAAAACIAQQGLHRILSVGVHWREVALSCAGDDPSVAMASARESAKSAWAPTSVLAKPIVTPVCLTDSNNAAVVVMQRALKVLHRFCVLPALPLDSCSGFALALQGKAKIGVPPRAQHERLFAKEALAQVLSFSTGVALSSQQSWLVFEAVRVAFAGVPSVVVDGVLDQLESLAAHGVVVADAYAGVKAALAQTVRDTSESPFRLKLFGLACPAQVVTDRVIAMITGGGVAVLQAQTPRNASDTGSNSESDDDDDGVEPWDSPDSGAESSSESDSGLEALDVEDNEDGGDVGSHPGDITWAVLARVVKHWHPLSVACLCEELKMRFGFAGTRRERHGVLSQLSVRLRDALEVGNQNRVWLLDACITAVIGHWPCTFERAPTVAGGIVCTFRPRHDVLMTAADDGVVVAKVRQHPGAATFSVTLNTAGNGPVPYLSDGVVGRDGTTAPALASRLHKLSFLVFISQPRVADAYLLPADRVAVAEELAHILEW